MFGVEPICRVLTGHGMPIAPSTYYEARGRARSRHAVRDEQLRGEVARVHRTNFSVYGARKVLLQLNREGIPVAHCTVRRLMAEQGLTGAHRGRKKRTTFADPQAVRAGDLVQRKFNPTAPNMLWVADFTYVSTWAGWVYVAFVIDAYSRRIVGWRVATSMSTQLVLDALERSIWTRARDGVTDLTGLIDHHDRSAQYTSIAYTERLSEAGIDASIGANGDSYDNALAETINGLYKTELIKPRGPWRTADHVEIATLEWVDWFNHRRLYETAETSHQPNSKPPTTVKQEPGNPPSSQTNKPPDTPSGFTGWQGPSVEKVEAACPPPVLAAAFFDAYPMSGPRFFGLDLVRVVDRIGGPTAWLMPGKRYTGEQTVGESV